MMPANILVVNTLVGAVCGSSINRVKRIRLHWLGSHVLIQERHKPHHIRTNDPVDGKSASLASKQLPDRGGQPALL